GKKLLISSKLVIMDPPKAIMVLATQQRKSLIQKGREARDQPSTIIHFEAKSKDKGMTYDDIRPIFEKKFNSNVAFLQKTKEQTDEEDSRALKRLSQTKEEKAAKKQKLDEEVAELKRHL
nr:hypothetical protein [Tanacetum cinerariifolium]